MIKKGTSFLCLLTFLSWSTFTLAGSDGHAAHEDFVHKFGNDVITILLNKNEEISVRKAHFRSELKKNFSLRAIGRFVVARYWRRMTKEQQETYLQLFENAVIENYASQFDDYNNETLIIKSSRGTRDGGVVVKSDIRRPGREPLHVDWKVFNTKRGLKVSDVIVNNISMSLTFRNEYASAINNRGGIEGLLEYLREKIKKNQDTY